MPVPDAALPLLKQQSPACMTGIVQLQACRQVHQPPAGSHPRHRSGLSHSTEHELRPEHRSCTFRLKTAAGTMMCALAATREKSRPTRGSSILMAGPLSACNRPTRRKAHASSCSTPWPCAQGFTQYTPGTKCLAQVKPTLGPPQYVPCWDTSLSPAIVPDEMQVLAHWRSRASTGLSLRGGK